MTDKRLPYKKALVAVINAPAATSNQFNRLTKEKSIEMDAKTKTTLKIKKLIPIP
jgi:hypothetical protein